MSERSDYCWAVDGDAWFVNASGANSDRAFDGPYKTRAAAFDAARASYPEATKIHTAECHWEGNAKFFDAKDVIERAADFAASEVEDSDFYPDVSDEATAELQAFLDQWTAKHLPDGPNWYECGCIEEHELVNGAWTSPPARTPFNCICADWTVAEGSVFDRNQYGGHHKDCYVTLVIGEGLGLFEVDEGVSHWVIAKDMDDAKAVVLEQQGLSARELGWTDEPPEVKHLTIAASEKLHFNDDDDEGGCSMRAAAEKNPVRRYVACSEY
jgi:hypothetical protein